MHSTPVRGTYPNRVRMSWWDYYVGHCWMTGWQTIRDNFQTWTDLVGSKYENYALPRTVEDPEQECIEWFWVGLNEDDVYPKKFLEKQYLMQMVDDIKTGKEQVIPLDENFFCRITDLSGELKNDED